MADPIALDMRNGLPKVRRSIKKLAASVGSCRYTSPCAVGAMMTPAQRKALSPNDDRRPVGKLIDARKITVPAEQRDDFKELQWAFDSGCESEFLQKVEELSRKYAVLA